MSSELLLLRHAKSDWTLAPGMTDLHRPLNARGRRDASRMGTWMHANAMQPQRVLCSPAQRTRETWQLVAQPLDRDPADVIWEDGIYEASVETLLALLGTQKPTPERLLMIGHNPGMEELLRYLSSDPIPAGPGGKLFPTATLARLEMPADWSTLSRGCATLLEIRRPKELQ